MAFSAAKGRRKSLQKSIFFVNTNENLAVKLSHSPKFQSLKCRFTLRNSSPRTPKIRTSLPPCIVLNSAQQVGGVGDVGDGVGGVGDVFFSKWPLWVMAALAVRK